MQLCNTLKRRTMQEITCSNLEKKSESESELTDFDILKSVIGITDIRVIG